MAGAAMTAVQAERVEPAPVPAAGQVGRRRPLPTGRAVAGAFFVAVAVIVIFAAWLAGAAPEGRSWTVAAHDLPSGARLRAADISTQSMVLPTSTTARLAFADPRALVGRVLDVPLRAGQLVQAGDVAAPATQPTLRPVTIAVTPSDLTGLTLGAPVDVLVTNGTGSAAATSVVVANGRVLDLGRESSSLVAGSGAQLTVGVSSLTDVTRLIRAAHTGSLSVVLGAAGDRLSPPGSTGSGLGSTDATTNGGSGSAGSGG